jgi:Tfp pilus assembly protein PilF
MTKKLLLAFALLVALSAATLSHAQAPSVKVEGKITDDDKPLADVNVTFTNSATGQIFKLKTDKSGNYAGFGVPVGEYKVAANTPTGEGLFSIPKTTVTRSGGAAFILNVDMAKVRKANLIAEAQAAMIAKNWERAISVLQQLIALDPKHWEFTQALGNSYFNIGNYEEAVNTYEKSIPLVYQALNSADPKADTIKVKTAIGQMLTNEGNAYLKLKKADKALELFSKAAETDPNPATAYFNLCATLYNIGQTQTTAVACDKAIAADPNKADAYFIKGSAMYSEATIGSQGKMTFLPGTLEALRKYLELAPNGSHAGDVKFMLDAAGAKIETTYQPKKK